MNNEIKILSRKTDSRKLFLVFWERMANSGKYMIWAKNPADACIYDTEFVEHTVVAITRPFEVYTKGSQK